MIKFHTSLLFLITIFFAKHVHGDFGLKDVYDVYTHCTENKTMEECLSTEIVSGLEKLEHQEKIPVLAGLELVRNFTQDNSSVDRETLKEDVVEESKPRASQSRQDALDELILKKIYNILKTHSLGFSSEEERGKSSKFGKAILPFLLGVMLKLGTFLPMVLSVLKVLAFKALLASKTALVLSVILGVKKLLDNQKEQQISQKSQVHHIYASPAPSYAEFAASNDLLRVGAGEHNHEEQQLSDSRSEDGTFAAGVYGRSLSSEDADSNSKVRKKSISSLHDIIHKTRTILA